VRFRCTRQAPYKAPSCPGRVDLSARVGYYIEASDHLDAKEQMSRRFPDDVKDYTSYVSAFSAEEA
jgi:hypothetical protein